MEYLGILSLCVTSVSLWGRAGEGCVGQGRAGVCGAGQGRAGSSSRGGQCGAVWGRAGQPDVPWLATFV